MMITRQQASLSHNRVHWSPAHTVPHAFGPIGTFSLAVSNVAGSRRLVCVGRRVLLLLLCSRNTPGSVLQSVAMQVVHVTPAQAPLDHKDPCMPRLRLADLLRARRLLRLPSVASNKHQHRSRCPITKPVATGSLDHAAIAHVTMDCVLKTQLVTAIQTTKSSGLASPVRDRESHHRITKVSDRVYCRCNTRINMSVPQRTAHRHP
jgi:hypothetical protein